MKVQLKWKIIKNSHFKHRDKQFFEGVYEDEFKTSPEFWWRHGYATFKKYKFKFKQILEILKKDIFLIFLIFNSIDASSACT